MKSAKILLLLIAILPLLLLTGCGARETSTLDSIRQKNKIVIGVKDDSKPFGYLECASPGARCRPENGKLKGFDIDIARAVAKGLLRTENPNAIEFKVLTPNEKIYALVTREVDMVIAVMSVTPQRLEIVSFSKPYYQAGLAVLTHEESRISSASMLNNKNVAVILGTTGEPNIRYLAPNARVRGARTYPEAFGLLKHGEVDAVFADDSLLSGFVLDNKDYKIQSRRYSEEFYAIAVRKDDKKLKNALDLIIDELQESGELAKLRKKYSLN